MPDTARSRHPDCSACAPAHGAARLVAVLDKCLAILNEARPVRALALSPEQHAVLKSLCLITAKPAMYVAHVRDDGFVDNPHLEAVKELAESEHSIVLTTAARKNGPSVAAEAKRSMAGGFELAMATLRVDRDPVCPVRRALPPNETQNKLALEPDEIGRLLRDMAGHGGRHETLAAFRLIWLRLCRPSETQEARWAEFDLDAALWSIRRSYNHVDCLADRAVMMQQRADLLNEWEKAAREGRDGVPSGA